MSVLLNKSLENIRAAELLITQHQYYATSVHCSYYSVFQLSVHILKQKFKMTDKEIELDAAFSQAGGNSHKKTFAAMYEKIDKANQRLKAVEYRRETNALKNKRVKADYSETSIDEPFSQEAYQQAQAINRLLHKIFSLS